MSDAFEAEIKVVYVPAALSVPLPIVQDIGPGETKTFRWSLQQRGVIHGLQCLGPEDAIVKGLFISGLNLFVGPCPAAQFAPPGRYYLGKWVELLDTIELVIERPASM